MRPVKERIVHKSLRVRSILAYIALLTGLALVAYSWPLSGMALEKENVMMSASDVEQRGKQLRAELEETYRVLKDARKLGASNKAEGIDVSATVAKYIPIGTSFDEAEKVLQAAGFNLAPRPPRPAGRENAPEWEKALRFTMGGGLVLDQTFGYQASVGVTLYPDSPGDPAAHVQEILARLRTSYL